MVSVWKKIETGEGGGECWAGDCYIKVGREGFTDKVTFEQRFERGERVNQVGMWDTAFQAEGKHLQRP